MIGTLMRIDWINLKRDRVALGLTFILPIIFFSIFALIFGGMASSSGGGSGGGSAGGGGSISVIVVDEDGTDVSRRFTESVDAQDALRVATAPKASDADPDPAPYTRESARQAVRRGDHPVAVIIPEGFADLFGNFVGEQAQVDLIYDAANPIAMNSVGGLLQAAAMMAAPEILMQSGLDQLELAGGFLTDDQKALIERIKPALRGEVPWESVDAPAADALDAEGEASPAPSFQGLVTVNATDARAGDGGEGDESVDHRSIIAYYAAAIGVMFLLFSMTGAAGSILEDDERGVLERLLTSRLGMRSMLLGHWLFFGLVGVAQLVFMFLWGEFVFGIDLFTTKHVVGFLIMAAFTGAAAAAFGMFLATLCKSRAQLSGISTIVILIMSALGGSMVPRFIAPFIQTTSRYTFNGWALDGFLKVFWHDDPNHSLLDSIFYLAPELAVMTGMTILLLALARLFARRWETV